MRLRNHLPRAAAALSALLAPLAAQDELGLGRMWTFHQPPLAYLEQEYGFRPDQRWLDTVRLASLRFGSGCSASFVSPKGLILTNHHCARDAIARVQGDRDWVRDGFVAGAYDDEVRLPDLTVQQLVRMSDVTARVDQGVTAADTADVAEQKRQQNQDLLLAESRQRDPGLQPQIVRLFQGAQFQLYQYRVFDDIRLVMAPHLQSAHFGGDPDNFVYPRYAIDFAFCRAWVDGAPADTREHCFGWSDGPREHQLVILTGNPGSTKRLLTKAELEFLRDSRYPRVRELIDNRIAIMRAMAAADPEQEKQLRTRILGFENGQKLYRGEHAALLDPAFLARKAAAEAAFQQRIAADPGLAGRYGATWQRLAELAAERRGLEAPLNFHSAGGLPLLLRALAMVAFERTGDLAAAARARDVRVAGDPLQQAFFVDHLVRAQHWLPPDDPYLLAMLDGQEPAAAAARLVAESRLGDDGVVASLLDGGSAAVAADNDLGLRIARVIEGLIERADAAGKRLTARENALGAELGRALFAAYGNAVTPDATFTLRFSDGRVRGYDYNGTRAPWRTVFHGLFARHAEFDGVHPFDLPAPWLLAKDRIDQRAAVDFVCTVDSTGGNSGSPLIDVEQRIVGLLFDGNIESLGNEFLYGERVERSVCVHPQAILEALTKVYDAQRIADELRRAR
jgi:hypothetical protein